MTDEDLMLTLPDLQFGSGVIGVCDICKKRQAVIVLSKERFQLCVLDFLNKAWIKSGAKPGAPLPPYRSERVWFPTDATKEQKAPAIVLTPTKPVRHPTVLVCPDIYGLTTALLDGAIRFAREGFEVMLPDVGKTSSVGSSDHLALRMGAHTRGGVPLDSPRIARMVHLYSDALAYLRGQEMVDVDKTALFGASYGGSLAIALATKDPRLSALLLAYPMPVRPPEELKLINSPTFLLLAGADPAAGRVRAQFAPYAGAGGLEVEFAEIPGARHHFLARDKAAYHLDAAEAGWSRLIGYAKARMMPPPPKPPAPPKTAGASTAGTAPGTDPLAGPPGSAATPVISAVPAPSS
ncbi:MAG: dienelactone hydrolase family protein [Thermoplasmata archaeon]|nr:dienelactone hydrolase family protein [Thermoplasmata archaeon]